MLARSAIDTTTVCEWDSSVLVIPLTPADGGEWMSSTDRLYVWWCELVTLVEYTMSAPSSAGGAAGLSLALDDSSVAQATRKRPTGRTSTLPTAIFKQFLRCIGSIPRGTDCELPVAPLLLDRFPSGAPAFDPRRHDENFRVTELDRRTGGRVAR